MHANDKLIVMETEKLLVRGFSHEGGSAHTPTSIHDQRPMINGLRRLYRKYCILREWNIGIVKAIPGDLEKLVAEGRLGTVTWCPRASPLSSRADPFVWAVNGDPRVIFEQIDHWSGRGHIRSLSLPRFSRLQRGRTEIVQPYHLSYPHIVPFEGVWYCTPESARAGGVDLYAWNPEMRSWGFKSRLIHDARILDATLFRRERIWYLFGTLRGDGSYDKLRIWWSNALDGEWRPHARNPVKVDIRSARSAGPVFEIGGRCYRPAQDCTNGYGRAVTLNRIDVLTPTEFSETTVSRVQPDPKGPYPDGLHTIAVFGDTVLIDGRRLGFSTALVLMKVIRRLARYSGFSKRSKQ